MKRIAILYGGKSGEHEVSLISAASVVRSLDEATWTILPIGISKTGLWLLQDEKAIRAAAVEGGGMQGLPPIEEGSLIHVTPGKGLSVESEKRRWVDLPCDVVFPVLHGTFGEDGTVQGLLECANLPYVGAGVLGSAIGMDKQITKELWMREGLPVVDGITARKNDVSTAAALALLARKIEARFGWPCFVKPASSGSSVGTAKVSSVDTLKAALENAFLYDEKALIEEFIPAREIECAVLGNENPRAFPPGEIVPSHEFYDYDAKYKDPEGAALLVPASLSESLSLQVREIALKAYKACSLSGMARVDFFIDKRTGNLFLNEVNTIPGFTAISMYPRMCAAGGLDFSELVENLVALALERHARREAIRYSI